MNKKMKGGMSRKEAMKACYPKAHKAVKIAEETNKFDQKFMTKLLINLSIS